MSESRKKNKKDGRSRRTDVDKPVLPGFFELSRMPDGSAVVRPKELADELSVRQACDMLKLSRTTVNLLCDMNRLQWRWATPRRGKRLIEAMSLCMYRDARAARADGRTRSK